MPQVARSQSRFTDKVVYLADEVDRQVKKAILTLEIKQPGVLKSRADQPAPSLNGVWNSRIAKQGNFLVPFVLCKCLQRCGLPSLQSEWCRPCCS